MVGCYFAAQSSQMRRDGWKTTVCSWTEYSGFNRKLKNMTKFAIYAELKAKEGKGEEVAAFLASARSLVRNEPETVAWFAVRFDDRNFGIFDTFDEESGRRAHLNGPIAQALMSRAAELFEAMPTIRQPDVIADKLPG